VSIILFCAALIVFALVGTGFFLLNAFGSPYETLHGPVGLYLWSFIACKCQRLPAFAARRVPRTGVGERVEDPGCTDSKLRKQS